jgi:hypothetical protein
MTLLYATGNLVDVDTLSAVSTEAAIYVKENLYNQRPSLPFRGTSNTTITIDVDAGVGNTIQPTLVSVINHNFATESVFNLEGSNVGFGGGGGENWDLTLCTNHNNSGRKITPSIGYRYWRLVITGTIVSGGATVVEIGEYILNDWTNFTTLYVVTEAEGLLIPAASSKTHYGQPWDQKYSEGMVFTIQPLQLTATAGNIDEMRLFLQALEGAAGRFVFSPDDTYIDTKCQLYYVHVVGTEYMASRIRDGGADLLQWNLRLEELPVGVTLI